MRGVIDSAMPLHSGGFFVACAHSKKLLLSLLFSTAALLAGCDDATPAVAKPEPSVVPGNTTPPPPTSNPPATPAPVISNRSVVVMWNEAMLAAIRASAPRPTVVSRAMFMVHSAMYDAWCVYDAVALPTVLKADRLASSQRTAGNKSAAVSQAAYHMLINFFPAYEANTHAFSNLLAALGYNVVTTADLATPGGIGYAAAQAQLQARSDDGSNAANNYADVTSVTYETLYAPVNSADPGGTNVPGGETFDANRWQPLRVPTGLVVDANGDPVADDAIPTSYKDQIFLTPHWGAVRSFALASIDEIRPSPPPLAGSNDAYIDAKGKVTTNDAAYREQVEEVLALSANLNDERKVIAEYWADGPRSETPPGHWNALAHGISERDKNTLDKDVKLYFVLNGAIFDAGIAVWEAKRFYDYVRPVSAIRHQYATEQINAWGGPNQGTVMMSGLLWRPYQSLTFVTPGFAEFVSGHSGFSAAAAEVLTRFTGSNMFYDGKTLLSDDFNNDGIPDLLGQHIATIGSFMFEDGPANVIELRWHTLQDAADEAGVSRRYGGIHFQDGDLRGRELGRKVAALAYAKALSYWDGTAK